MYIPVNSRFTLIVTSGENVQRWLKVVSLQYCKQILKQRGAIYTGLMHKIIVLNLNISFYRKSRDSWGQCILESLTY